MNKQKKWKYLNTSIQKKKTWHEINNDDYTNIKLTSLAQYHWMSWFLLSMNCLFLFLEILPAFSEVLCSSARFKQFQCSISQNSTTIHTVTKRTPTHDPLAGSQCHCSSASSPFIVSAQTTSHYENTQASLRWTSNVFKTAPPKNRDHKRFLQFVQALEYPQGR